MSQKVYKIFIRLFLLGLFAPALLWRCASVMAPMGGPRDSLPPRIMAMTPAYGVTNFTGKRIYIEFDEYVQIKDQQKEFFVSPRTKNPTLTLRGRGIQIDLRDSLRPNQTYALNFGSAIRDNNEDNPLNDFRFVFSTGPTIDSLLMSGYVVDAYTRDSASKSFLFFYPALMDTTPDYDSLLFREPAVIGRAQPNGLFIAENLKPIPYRVYALDDKNGNMIYDPGVDKVAFLDSVYNPVAMPGFMIRYDTMRKYNVPDPQLYLRAFMDEGFRRQALKTAKRPLQHRIDMVFGAPNPVIERFVLNGIDSSRIITQDLRSTHDSLFLWLDVPSEQLPDTIKGEITFLKHDSVNVLQSVTQPLSLVWRDLSKKKDKEKENKKDTLPPPNPFSIKVDASSQLNPFKNIPISFEYPLTGFDSAAVQLVRIEETKVKDKDGKETTQKKPIPAKFHFVQDTVDMRNWVLRAEWVGESKYELTIPSGTFRNVAAQQNDSLKAAFTVLGEEKFAILDLNIVGKTPESEYVVQVIDASGRALREIRHTKSGKLTIPWLEAGKVRIRVLEDMNGNGVWDTGNLIKRIQPERTELFSMPLGGTELTMKENWTYDFTIDMNVLFAPVTMESVIQQLREMERERIDKILKEKAEQQKKKSTTPRSSGSNSGYDQGSSGMSNGMGSGGMGGGSMPMRLPGR